MKIRAGADGPSPLYPADEEADPLPLPLPLACVAAGATGCITLPEAVCLDGAAKAALGQSQAK